MKNLKLNVIIIFFLVSFPWLQVPERGYAYTPSNFSVSSFDEILTKAKRGDRDAQYNLGIIYFIGNGVPQDKKMAAEWFMKAAEQGNPEAQHRLGIMYYTGEGVIQDKKKAAEWFSMTNLGL